MGKGTRNRQVRAEDKVVSPSKHVQKQNKSVVYGTWALGIFAIILVVSLLFTGLATTGVFLRSRTAAETEDFEMDGAMVSYAYEATSDTWVRTTQENYGDMMNQFAGMQQSLAQMPKELMTLAEEQVTVNERACYALTVNMSGDQFQTYMSDYMGTIMSQITGTGEMDEESLAMMEQMDWTNLRTTCVYHVDAETFLPLEMTMEIKGMGDVLNDLLVSMMGMQTGDLEFTIDVPTVKMVAKNMVYNEAVEIPALPQEAVENAVDADSLDETLNEELVDGEEEYLVNPPQEDGSYLITLGQDIVRVMVPEGYPVMDSGTDYVVGIAEDGYNSVYYMLYNDMTSDDVVTMFNEEVVWAQDNGWYGSHTEPTELEGYTAMGLIYNDDTSTWYAWRELKDSILLLGTDCDAVDFDLTTLFATVEIIG